MVRKLRRIFSREKLASRGSRVLESFEKIGVCTDEFISLSRIRMYLENTWSLTSLTRICHSDRWLIRPLGFLGSGYGICQPLCTRGAYVGSPSRG